MHVWMRWRRELPSAASLGLHPKARLSDVIRAFPDAVALVVPDGAELNRARVVAVPCALPPA